MSRPVGALFFLGAVFVPRAYLPRALLWAVVRRLFGTLLSAIKKALVLFDEGFFVVGPEGLEPPANRL